MVMKAFLLITFTLVCNSLYSAVDSKEFYHVFASGSLNDINTFIQNIESSEPNSQSNAYMGALLMKKAGLEKYPLEKLNTFKSGHKLLEAEISKNPNDPELRFLRLVIQESAPEILNYRSNLAEDKGIVVKGFKGLDSNVQEYILQYCKESKVLTVNDFQ